MRVASEPLSPRRHLGGTLELLKRLGALGRDHRALPAVLRLLGRPAPHAPAAPSAPALKYDVYAAFSAGSSAWGVTVNDSHEPEAWLLEVERWVGELGARYAFERVRRARGGLPASWGHTFSIGFDDPREPPRLKLYVQEQRWNSGELDAAGVLSWMRSLDPGVALPAWVAPERTVGVVAVDLFASGALRFKLYLGGDTGAAAARGAPPEVQELAQRLDRTCPLGGLWHYLTLRLTSGAEPGYTINKIYNPVGMLGDASGRQLAESWRDVERLFADAGQGSALETLRAAFEAPNLYVAPTATALESGGGVDVYCAAWRLAPAAPNPRPRSTELEWTGRLYSPDRRERAFHLVSLGFPKTGSTSLATMFQRFRTAHEFWCGQVTEAVLAERRGTGSEAEVRAVLQAREQAGLLEVDAATFLHAAVEEVVRLYPSSKFVFVWRPFDEWLESLLGMLLERGSSETGREWPAWVRAMLSLVFGDFRPEWFASVENLRAAQPLLAAHALEYWLDAMRRCLDALPAHALVFPLSELDAAAPRLAELTGVPAEALVPARERVGSPKHGLMQALPAAFHDEAASRTAPLLERARRSR